MVSSDFNSTSWASAAVLRAADESGSTGIWVSSAAALSDAAVLLSTSTCLFAQYYGSSESISEHRAKSYPVSFYLAITLFLVHWMVVWVVLVILCAGMFYHGDRDTSWGDYAELSSFGNDLATTLNRSPTTCAACPKPAQQKSSSGSLV